MDRVTGDPRAQVPTGPHAHADVRAAGGHELEPGQLPAWQRCMYPTILSTPGFSEGCHSGHWQRDMIMNLHTTQHCSPTAELQVENNKW